MACLRERNGKWVIDFRDQYGKRRWKTLKQGLSMRDMEAEMRKVLEEVDADRYLSRRDLPRFKDVAKDWLDHKKLGILETTRANYDGHIRNHLADLHHMKVDRVSSSVVEKLIDDMAERGVRTGTIRKVCITLGMILSYAVRHRYITYNVMKDAERPREKRPAAERKRDFLLPAEIRALIGSVADPMYRMLFTLAAMTGMRQGELLGLRWEDVDWQASQVLVQRSFTKGQWHPTKTKGSRRRVDIGPALLQELRAWRLACPRSGPPDQRAGPGLVFPNGAGNPLNYSNMVRRHFLPALKAAKVMRVKFHSLRHSYASIQADQGESERYIQAQLGHTNSRITREVYTHLLADRNPEAARRLERRILGQSGRKTVDRPRLKLVKGLKR